MSYIKNNMVYGLAFLVGFGSMACKTTATASEKTNGKDEPQGTILFLTTRDGNFEIYRMDTNGDRAQNLTNNKAMDYWVSFHQGQNRIFFYSKRDGNDEIYFMDLDGQHQTNVSNHPSGDRLPIVSPDGKSIAFLSNRDDENGELYTMTSEGTNIIRLTYNHVSEDVACWSPDGKWIFYGKDAKVSTDTLSNEDSDFEIFRMHADGTAEKRLTHFPGFCAAPSISPNGKQIAFYGRGAEGNLDIFTMQRSGKNIINLTKDAVEDFSPSWSPDGKWLAYTSGDASNYDIWIIRLSTGEKRRLTSQPKRDETPVWIK